ncbi:hypothetical protein ACFO5R_17600 [Halosolutus amylolyticus]|uniref:Rho termination factor N-terminal domain-containing protein n=1 Tax=Halosolutus amylolyticus TaxID=2932267 RepID=A0ABD5PT34_9EURY|nr:hypothetical protein [Halosolutus amylolyticus]
MSDDSGLTEAVTTEVTNQVGVAELLGDGDIEDEIDGDEIGAAVGRRFGERIGRELGGSIGREVHEALAQGVEEEKDLSELRSDVTSGVKEGFGDALDELGGREALESLAGSVTDGGRLGGILDRDESAGESAIEDEEAPEEDETAEEDEEAPEEDETAEEDEEAPEEDETAEEEDEAAEKDESSEEEEEAPEEEEAAEKADEDESDSEPSAEDLEDLRRETLADFLGVMSYQDLQSIAKDVDVKANLSREEMTDEIIETVTSDDEASAGEDGESTGDDGESADEATQEAE